MFLKTSTDPFEYELIESFIFFSNGNRQVENDGIFDDFLFNLKI